MTITYRGAIAIVQLIAYVPCLVLGFLLALRHGFSKSSGWLFIISFTLLRTTGAICELIAMSDSSMGVVTTVLICSFIGIAPLMLWAYSPGCTFSSQYGGLGNRHGSNVQCRNDSTTDRLHPLVFRGVSLISLPGLILGIVGGVFLSEATDHFALNPETKAAAVFFAILFIAMLTLFCALCLRMSQVKPGEKRLLLAVSISCPFLAIRVIYALISDFAGNSAFNAIYGNITIYLCMDVIEEIIVVLICVTVGITVRKVPKGATKGTEEGVASTNLRNRGSDQVSLAAADDTPFVGRGGDKQLGAGDGTRQYNLWTPKPQTKVRGPVTWLLDTGKDYYRSRRTVGN